MSERIDWFYSFRSPYSYLSGARGFDLVDDYDIDLRFRGVIPMMMRGESVPMSKRIHTLRDVKCEADRLGIPFGRTHDPLGDAATRMLAVSEYAIDQGHVREFVLAASTSTWAEAMDLATDEDMKVVCDRAGLDWEGCVAAMNDPEIAARVEANTQELVEIGHWGVPVFVFRGEQFWGQDRIDDVKLALDEAGLRRA